MFDKGLGGLILQEDSTAPLQACGHITNCAQGPNVSLPHILHRQAAQSLPWRKTFDRNKTQIPPVF